MQASLSPQGGEPAWEKAECRMMRGAPLPGEPPVPTLAGHWDKDPGRIACARAVSSLRGTFRPPRGGRGHRRAMSLPQSGSGGWQGQNRKRRPNWEMFRRVYDCVTYFTSLFATLISLAQQDFRVMVRWRLGERPWLREGTILRSEPGVGFRANGGGGGNRNCARRIIVVCSFARWRE